MNCIIDIARCLSSIVFDSRGGVIKNSVLIGAKQCLYPLQTIVNIPQLLVSGRSCPLCPTYVCCCTHPHACVYFTWGPTPVHFLCMRVPMRGLRLDLRPLRSLHLPLVSFRSHTHAQGPAATRRWLRQVTTTTCAAQELLYSIQMKHL
jgi:hypothetical protein